MKFFRELQIFFVLHNLEWNDRNVWQEYLAKFFLDEKYLRRSNRGYVVSGHSSNVRYSFCEGVKDSFARLVEFLFI